MSKIAIRQFSGKIVYSENYNFIHTFRIRKLSYLKCLLNKRILNISLKQPINNQLIIILINNQQIMKVKYNHLNHLYIFFKCL